MNFSTKLACLLLYTRDAVVWVGCALLYEVWSSLKWVFKLVYCLFYRGFSVPAFDVFLKYACIGGEYLSNADELGVCFGGDLISGHYFVLADSVENISDRISVDVDVVDCLLEDIFCRYGINSSCCLRRCM